MQPREGEGDEGLTQNVTVTRGRTRSSGQREMGSTPETLTGRRTQNRKSWRESQQTWEMSKKFSDGSFKDPKREAETQSTMTVHNIDIKTIKMMIQIFSGR